MNAGINIKGTAIIITISDESIFPKSLINKNALLGKTSSI